MAHSLRHAGWLDSIRRHGVLPACLAALALLAGCGTPVSVRTVDQRVEYQRLARNAMSFEGLSEETRNVLRRRALLETFERRPADGIAAMHARVVAGQDEPGELFALAEMSYLHGRGRGGAPHLLAAALYAYGHLFATSRSDATEAFDPRFRQALDLYNLALSEALTAPGGGPEGGRVAIASGRYPLPFGSIDITLDEHSIEWGDGRLSDFLPASRMQVSGLENLYRRAGIGAPLAVRTPAPAAEVSGGGTPVAVAADEDTPAVAPDPLRPGRGVRVAGRFRVPGTAVLVLEEPARQLRGGELHGTLALHMMFDAAAVSIAGRRVPLEYRPSAAFAEGLAESNLWSQELRAFLFGSLLDQMPSQLVALAPHRPGRIPVVLVHGTASSSSRWADMVNDLISDPVIEANYEFWFFTYATGNPVPYSALQLREALAASMAALNSPTADPALGQMVVIGHSQGGLLTKMMAIDPGDRLWSEVSRRPPEALGLSPHSLDLIRRAFFFHPVPQVRRVVFIATPHGGSFLTEFGIVRMISRLITLPVAVAQVGVEVLSGDPEAAGLVPSGMRMGSLYSMLPGSSFLRALRPIPLAPGVTGHSIIAVRGDGPPEGQSDGVVAFDSAYLPGMASTKIVRSSHSTQSNPNTVNEVRRILLTHLREACGTALRCTRPPDMASR
ncbi:alpha/beta hydrolase [Roseomonas sp. NAR14]|uniref:Alpha/beta hydrolase n=1 Tax=Roseomonas acroporae TaxID=2937791 RepID=A0A9X2BYR8_9PROT|nr:alpha/beta hydrolase [Roseomonas acroporae]MCK8787229.1 alpha/beta hydrolase [Roseomonas acroporae]